jgi:CheY-like chemotaxis protein
MKTAASCFSGGPKTILICDDERHIVRLLQVNLERHGHAVAVAFDVRECLKKLGEGGIDLLILDGDITFGGRKRSSISWMDGFPLSFWKSQRQRRLMMTIGRVLLRGQI